MPLQKTQEEILKVNRDEAGTEVKEELQGARAQAERRAPEGKTRETEMLQTPCEVDDAVIKAPRVGTDAATKEALEQSQDWKPRSEHNKRALKQAGMLGELQAAIGSWVQENKEVLGCQESRATVMYDRHQYDAFKCGIWVLYMTELWQQWLREQDGAWIQRVYTATLQTTRNVMLHTAEIAQGCRERFRPKVEAAIRREDMPPTAEENEVEEVVSETEAKKPRMQKTQGQADGVINACMVRITQDYVTRKQIEEATQTGQRHASTNGCEGKFPGNERRGLRPHKTHDRGAERPGMGCQKARGTGDDGGRKLEILARRWEAGTIPAGGQGCHGGTGGGPTNTTCNAKHGDSTHEGRRRSYQTDGRRNGTHEGGRKQRRAGSGPGHIQRKKDDTNYAPIPNRKCRAGKPKTRGGTGYDGAQALATHKGAKENDGNGGVQQVTN
ncbi:hypothetical protein CYMTET_19182 [Cymbomonas tetramitiformis]|uniref:Uncharacterized protein n=1 Tax=Cymbomonas tetramitiformis TaxID=36881 RepID=A0AAE0L5K1_9CHLO|nr:hypothetical protein CYMTET_19182 [Cymbomonas tetramitiformis]